MQVDRSAAEGVAEIMNGAGGHTPVATAPPTESACPQEKLRLRSHVRGQGRRIKMRVSRRLGTPSMNTLLCYCTLRLRVLCYCTLRLRGGFLVFLVTEWLMASHSIGFL